MYYGYISGLAAGYIAVTALHFIGLVILIGFAFSKCQGWNTPGSHKQTFFGFRIALVLATLSMLITIITISVLAADASPGSYFSILGIFGWVLYLFVRPLMSYALIRLAYSPLVAAGAFRRDKTVAQVAFGFSLLTGVALTVADIYLEAIIIGNNRGVSTSSGTSVYRLLSATNALAVVDQGVFMVIGAVGLGAAVHSFRKSKYTEVHPEVRRAVKLMIGAASVWTAIATILTVFYGLTLGPRLSHGAVAAIAGTSIEIQVLYSGLNLILDVVVFALFTAAFRKVKDSLPL